MSICKFRLIRPARYLPKSQIKVIKQFLKIQWNAIVEYGDEVFTPRDTADKAQVLISHLKDPCVGCLWAIHGGEGTADLLPYIARKLDLLKRIRPKIVIGSSDVTALINYLAKELKWPVIHGPNASQIGRSGLEKSLPVLKGLIFKGNEPIVIPSLVPLNDQALRADILIASGCIGGNLSLLNISIKDIWEFRGEGKIIFIEECGEKAHVIDRTLKYLYRVGKFKSAKALIIGDIFHDLVVPASDEKMKHIEYLRGRLESFAAMLNIPVLTTTNIGHGSENYPIPFNWKAQLELGLESKLILIPPGIKE